MLLSKFIGGAVGYLWAVRSVYIVNYNIIAFAPFGVYRTSLYTIVPSSFILRGGDAGIPVLRSRSTNTPAHTDGRVRYLRRRQVCAIC